VATETLESLYLDELSYLYDAESRSLRLLWRLQEATHTPALRHELGKQCDESRLHLERLQLIFTRWGADARVRPCLGLAGIIEEADDRLHEAGSAEVNDHVIVSIARRMEHYEMASYGAARALARRLNRVDEARLLQETLDDEVRADGRLAEIGQANGSRPESVVSFVAPLRMASATTPPQGDKLR
jgi:ferritin-like metal-binding protein YciE